MNRFRPLSLAFAALALSGCASSSSQPPPAADAAADPSQYTPKGCAYTTAFAEDRGSGYSFDSPTLGAAPSPKRIRAGLGGSLDSTSPSYANPSTSVAFAWDTDVDTLASRLRYGNAPDKLESETTGDSYVLPGSWPQRVHQVHLCGLQPDTTYYYQVGGGPSGQEAWSDVRSITTFKPSGVPARITIGVAGDSRDSPDVIWPMVQARFAELDVTFQLFSGDTVVLSTNDVAKYYARWYDKIEEAGNLGTKLMLPVGGNHEKMTLSWLSYMPAPGSGPTSGLFYSFDVGSAHFVLLDDQPLSLNVANPPNVRADMLAWLDADLTAANARRDKVPFIIVMHHRGELSTSEHSVDSDVASMRQLLMPVWDQHKVDVVLNGHDHNYERSKPVRGTWGALSIQPDPTQGTTYIVCAGAGADAYAPGSTPADWRAINVGYDTGIYVGVYGWLELDDRKLTWKAWGLNKNTTQVSGDTLIDQFELQK
ncbi:MAG: metallophosphoesterase family protein [Deltaproteobacteria bacterium]|nr:metallophosphoesterase family protein [Deltaproteobacteria bacterium]